LFLSFYFFSFLFIFPYSFFQRKNLLDDNNKHPLPPHQSHVKKGSKLLPSQVHTRHRAGIDERAAAGDAGATAAGRQAGSQERGQKRRRRKEKTPQVRTGESYGRLQMATKRTQLVLLGFYA
jgi:hypothetical protein